MHTRVKRSRSFCIVPLAFTALTALFGVLLTPTVSSAEPSGCLSLDSATPTEHLDRAIRDVRYGACLSQLARQQKAVCDAQPKPSPGDPQAAAQQRFCLQLVMLFDDLAVNFLPGSGYPAAVADCAASKASIPCGHKAEAETRMRCLIALNLGQTAPGCLPAFPGSPPGKK